MELFPDGAFVRLESRGVSGKFLSRGVPGKFVHADDDWEGVSLRRNSGAVPALNAVWRVERLVGERYTYVLLQNAAYGRYLSYSPEKAGPGHRGFRATQRNRSEPGAGSFDPRRQPYPWMWTVQRLPAPDEDYVTLRYTTCYLGPCYLCANGWLLRWNKRVTANPAALTTMMHWKVHLVQQSPLLRPLPLTLEHQGDAQLPPRTIRHVLANDDGEFDQNHHNWASFPFYQSTASFLKDELQILQGWNEDIAAYTLCMRPGSHGRLMPLATNYLPGSLDSMNIVVFRTGTPGAAALRYPAAAADDAAA